MVMIQDDSSSPPIIEQLEAVLVDLQRALKSLGFYPPGHPSRLKMIETSFSSLHDQCQSTYPLTLNISRQGFSFKQNLIAKGNYSLEEMAKDLLLRQIKTISFFPSFTLSDLTSFLSIFEIDPEVLHQRGGMEKYCMDSKIQGIDVNELRLDHLREIGAVPPSAPAEDQGVDSNITGEQKSPPSPPGLEDLPEISEETSLLQGEEGPKEPSPASLRDLEPTGEPEESPTLVSPEFDSAVDSESSDPLELLRQLKEANDNQVCQYLLDRYQKASWPYLSKGEYEELLPLIQDILSPVSPDQISTPLRSFPRSKLMEYLCPPTLIEDLLNDFCGHRPEKTETLKHFLISLGEQVVEPIFGRLKSASLSTIRQSLLSLLVAIGDPTIPHIKNHLKHPDDTLVKDMVILLGQIPHNQSVSLLGSALKHRDRNIQREALRSMARLGGKRELQILLLCLKSPRPLFKEEATICLGNIKEPTAVEPLKHLAGRNWPWKEGTCRKEAVKSLGKIATPEALNFLSDLLFKKPRIWRRTYDRQIQSLCLSIFQHAEGDLPQQVIQKAKNSSDPWLQQACSHLGAPTDLPPEQTETQTGEE